MSIKQNVKSIRIILEQIAKLQESANPEDKNGIKKHVDFFQLSLTQIDLEKSYKQLIRLQ